MTNKSDLSRDAFMLKGGLARCGYDWWWHSFTGRHRITGAEKAFFIEFFACNPELGEETPVLGQLAENRAVKKKPSYLMVKVGAWGENATQLHRFFGWKHVKITEGAPIRVSAEDCYLSETVTRGSVRVTQAESAAHPEYMCGAGTASWNLTIEKKIAYNVGYGASGPLRASEAFEMFWHAEGMKTFYSGEMLWNGEVYDVTPETCYGYADKNWGKNFTSPWVWLSSCNLTSKKTGKRLENSVFDIGGGRPKIGPVALSRKLLSAFCYEGKIFEFNFSKFWTGTVTEFDCIETDTQVMWYVEQKTPRSRMVTNITCEKKDMLWINYEAPDGLKRHNRLWNGGNGRGTVKLYVRHGRHERLLDEVMVANAGCEYGEYDPE